MEPIIIKNTKSKRKNDFEYSFLNDKGEFLGHIYIWENLVYNVYVSRKQRGKGICKKMMSYAVKKNKKLYLHVRPNNEAAIKCYESVGFKKKLLKNFYHDFYGGKPENIYLMSYNS